MPRHGTLPGASGEVPEWLNGRDWKSRNGLNPVRGFESPSLRHQFVVRNTAETESLGELDLQLLGALGVPERQNLSFNVLGQAISQEYGVGLGTSARALERRGPHLVWLMSESYHKLRTW